MLLKFTNVAEQHKGNSLYINPDHIIAVYEIAKAPGGSLTTVIYGGIGQGTSWEVEESLSEVIKKVNEIEQR